MPRQIAILGLVLIMGAFTWHRVILLNYYQSINRDIAEFEKVGEFIKPQSILYPIDCSDSWFQPHFHCYLGVDKVLIDLANPQLNGPMPLLWNSEKMPRVLIGEFTQNQSGGYWDGGNINLTPVLSDYILIWKPQYLETNPNAEALLDKVSPYYYNQIALSESGDVVLYRLNNQNE